MIVVGYCRCGAPVFATHAAAGAVQRTCSDHFLDLAAYVVPDKPGAALDVPTKENP